MSSARFKHLYILVLISILCGLVNAEEEQITSITGNEHMLESSNVTSIPAGRSLFNPKIDYNNKWMPVGRGDPLKNDPTYDYSPPVLDRVRYWADSSTGSNTKKQEILLLGVSAKRPLHRKIDTLPSQSLIRKNHYPQLPTVLMPPPVQTLASMHNNRLHKDLSSHQHHRHPMENIWPPQISSFTDSSVEESSNVINVAKPNTAHKQTPDYYDSYKQYEHTTVQKKPWIQALLHKEVTKPTTWTMEQSMSYTPTIYESFSVETSTHFTPTIPPPISTSPVTSVNPIFEQSKPSLMNVPMYLIIQGHSKVKTYGQSDDGAKKLPKIVPVENVENPIIKHITSNSENNGSTIPIVKHLHKTEIKEIPDVPSKKDIPIMGGLLSLLDSSFGDFLLSNEEEPNKQNFELNVNEIPRNQKISYREERENNENIKNSTKEK